MGFDIEKLPLEKIATFCGGALAGFISHKILSSGESYPRCGVCGKITASRDNYYMVVDKVWNECGLGTREMCPDCLEMRMGREFKPEDIAIVPINFNNKRMIDAAKWTKKDIRKYKKDYKEMIRQMKRGYKFKDVLKGYKPLEPVKES